MGTPEHQSDLKQKYHEMLKKLAKNKRPKDIMRRQWIKLTIQRILSAKDNEDKSNLPHLVKDALESFDLDNTGREPRLVTKLDKFNEHKKIVIPLEDSFEIVLKAHLFTHHGGCAAMNKWLSDYKYEPSIICVPALINVCQQCQLGTTNSQIIIIDDTPNNTIVPSEKPFKRTSKTPRAKRKAKTIKVAESSDNIVKEIPEVTSAEIPKVTPAEIPKVTPAEIPKVTPAEIPKVTPAEIPKVTQALNDVNINIISKMSISTVNLIDMSSRPDNSFHFLLIHQDINTRFVQIRPITQHDLVEEISMELVKLFCDFAPPQCLILRSDLMTIFEGVVARLNVIFDPKIAIETCGPAEIKISKDITEKILLWMTKNECNSWSIGCHYVQWDLNKCVDNDGTSPYEKFFAINSKHEENIRNMQLYSINNEVKNDKEKHICCTCKDLMRSEVYFCCMCKKSLHLYCGARRQSDNDVMENICYSCLNL